MEGWCPGLVFRSTCLRHSCNIQLGKTMMWYDVVLAGLHYQRYQHTEKEALDCSTTGISVKCKSSRAYFSVGAYTCAALHYSHQCKSLHDLVPLMSCSLLQCSITNSCSSLRSFSPHSHPWNHCYALLNQLRISYKSAINQIWVYRLQ